MRKHLQFTSTLKLAWLSGVSLAMICVCSFGCRATCADPFAVTKQFRPQDKYFSAGLTTLHFSIEVSETSELEELLKGVIDRYKIPTTSTGAKDGVFIGESPYDAFGYKHVIELEIVNEKIVGVVYDEVKETGHGKKNDAKYCEQMSTTGTTPAIAYPIYEAALKQSQNIMEVDGVSGATYSQYRFKYAAAMALINASI